MSMTPYRGDVAVYWTDVGCVDSIACPFKLNTVSKKTTSDSAGMCIGHECMAWIPQAKIRHGEVDDYDEDWGICGMLPIYSGIFNPSFK